MAKMRLHNLARPKVRQSWNKYNLYNLSRLRVPNITNKTFFQQKWIAKSLMRGYHGEHIKERQWASMFKRRLPAVIDMDPQYMAMFDGSEQARGRGTGLETPIGHVPELNPSSGTNLKTVNATPFMQMLFGPMERRLDVAIFRAMFASSARQARQFVVHGSVYVNGKKMVYPGYLLNPGDMFQVDVDRVLFATGTKKSSYKRKGALPSTRPSLQNRDSTVAEAVSAELSGDINAQVATELPVLVRQVKKLLSVPQHDLTVKRKKILRRFVRNARKWVAIADGEVKKDAEGAGAGEGAEEAAEAAAESGETAQVKTKSSTEVIDRLAELLAAMPALSNDGEAAGIVKEAKEVTQAKENKQLKDATSGSLTEKAFSSWKQVAALDPEEKEQFQDLLYKNAINPVDPSKPYATPWRPKPYMKAFATIPRYLEVNQKICAAVYLRHPVARPGQSEVPSPFPQELSQLVFNWYLRRR